MKDFDDDGLLKKTIINQETKEKLEQPNLYKSEFANIIAKAQKLVGCFKHSINLSKNLFDKQKQLKLEFKRS